MTDTTPETDVPPEETAAARCPYCDRPFSSERSRALHAGETHSDGLTEADAEAYEQARKEEEEELFGFHMKVFIAIAVIQIVIVILYMIAFAT